MNIKPKYRINDDDETIYLDADTEFEGIIIPSARDIIEGDTFCVYLEFKDSNEQEYSIMFDPRVLVMMVIENHQELIELGGILQEQENLES